MANSFAPFGFRSFGHRDGSAPTMGLERVFIASSDTNLYFTGDPVALSSAASMVGNIQPFEGSSASTPAVYGIFMGCEFFNPSTQQIQFSRAYLGTAPGSSGVPKITAWIQSDPEMQFIAQCSTSAVVGTSLIGWGIGVAAAQSSLGDQTSGNSRVALASSQVGSTAAGVPPFQIVDMYSNFAPPGVNGTDNTVAGAIAVVTPMNWVRHAPATTAVSS